MRHEIKSCLKQISDCIDSGTMLLQSAFLLLR